MEDRLDHLFQHLHKLGGKVLLAELNASAPALMAEEVIAESTALCRESSRLTWVVLDLLINRIEQLNENVLLAHTRKRGNRSVLGVLSDAAYSKIQNPKFKRIIGSCAPHDRLEPFFHRVGRSPLATRLSRENALEVFHRWNFVCSELRYL